VSLAQKKAVRALGGWSRNGPAAIKPRAIKNPKDTLFLGVFRYFGARDGIEPPTRGFSILRTAQRHRFLIKNSTVAVQCSVFTDYPDRIQGCLHAFPATRRWRSGSICGTVSSGGSSDSCSWASIIGGCSFCALSPRDIGTLGHASARLLELHRR
jgi:hypothetical protein